MANDNASVDPNDLLEDLISQAKQDDNRCERTLVALQNILEKQFPQVQLVMFGSTKNGLSLKNSDVDLGLRYETDQPELEVLTNIQSILIQHGLSDAKLVDANGKWLLRYTHQQSHNQPDICSFDITFWDSYVGQNSDLVHKMCSFDKRYPKLLILLKVWMRNLKKKHGTVFYSHAVNLWVMCFLQSRNPPVLPKIETDEQADWKSQNTSSLFDLLLEFFAFWKDFDFQSNRISVLQATPFGPKERKSKFIEIEDPILPTFNAAVYLRKANKFKVFTEELHITFEQVKHLNFDKFVYS